MFSHTTTILTDEPIDVFNHGHDQRDFTYIGDIDEGVIGTRDHVAAPNPDWSGERPDSASSKAPYRLYNIGSNSPIELQSYIESLEQCLGRKAKKNFLPIQLGDVPSTYADVDALIQDVGFRPSTTIETGIARFVQWYKRYYRL